MKGSGLSTEFYKMKKFCQLRTTPSFLKRKGSLLSLNEEKVRMEGFSVCNCLFFFFFYCCHLKGRGHSEKKERKTTDTLHSSFSMSGWVVSLRAAGCPLGINKLNSKGLWIVYLRNKHTINPHSLEVQRGFYSLRLMDAPTPYTQHPSTVSLKE